MPTSADNNTHFEPIEFYEVENSTLLVGHEPMTPQL